VFAEFAAGLDEIVVVEDKRAFLEDALKTVLYGRAAAPAVYGKRDRDGTALFSSFGELDPDSVATRNSSTKVAPGTLVGGGIGCHAMVLFTPECGGRAERRWTRLASRGCAGGAVPDR
jgi:indolepyruvate ferredoxin oxidoreductase